MKVQVCPKCKSAKVNLDLGGQTGKYKCEKCGYVGSLIIEKEIKKRN